MVAGPNAPSVWQFYEREPAPDQPREWTPSDRAILLLIIAGTVVGLGVILSFFL